MAMVPGGMHGFSGLWPPREHWDICMDGTRLEVGGHLPEAEERTQGRALQRRKRRFYKAVESRRARTPRRAYVCCACLGRPFRLLGRTDADVPPSCLRLYATLGFFGGMPEARPARLPPDRSAQERVRSAGLRLVMLGIF